MRLESGPFIERIEDLEAKVQELKDALGVDYEYEKLRLIGLTNNQAKLIGLLLKREIATPAQLLVAAYIDQEPDVRYERIKRSIVIPLSQARRTTLKRLGVQIENVQSYGWRMPPESKAKLKSLMDRQFLKQAAE